VENILIVDDARTDRELLAKVVVKAGYNAVFASDGDETLEAVKTLRPRLVFLDVVMARTNGYNACRLLKGDPATKDVPVVLVTSKNADSDKFWGKKQGADDQLGKPFTPESVLAVITRFLG
jgi:twitching motility two-component system response regulator PilH